MVVGQVALAVVLLSGAGLLAAEFLRLVTEETGFDPERLLVASLPISMTGSPGPRRSAGAALACAVLAACYFPARRAARIDPAPLLHDA